MKITNILRHKNKLDALFLKVRELPDDLEIKAEFSRYLCVRVSGFIEVSIRSIYLEYVRPRAQKNIVNFVERNIRHFRNPKINAIVALAEKFDSEWADYLKNGLDQRFRDTVNSVVDIRNKIAHGEDTDISYVRIKDYYNDVLKFLDVIESQCERN